MKYDINLKNIKKSTNLLADSLKEFDIPKSKVIEAFAKSLYYKNWNTLHGITQKPQIIKHLDIEKKYLFEIEANIGKSELLSKVNKAFNLVGANLEIINFLEDNNYFHIELNLLKSDKNILTAIFLFAQELKPYNVKRFDYCRVVCEKESFMKMYS